MSTAKRAAVIASLLGVLAAAGLALASTAPPPPAITAAPAAYTNSPSASFRFTDSASKVTFACSLDGATFTACASPRSYTSLGAGRHTFAVEAVDSKGATSEAASRGWTIVLTAPTIVVSFPPNGSLVGPAGWPGGCHPAGVCGTATDASGVSAVSVSILQNATGRYWNGTSYSGTAEAYLQAVLAKTETGANWSYGLPLPSPDGSYTLHVLASDGAGNQTPRGSPAAATFAVKATPPPAPVLTGTPANPTSSQSATFAFNDAEAGTTFQCKLDDREPSRCTSPVTYTGLADDEHTFEVRAVDSAGNLSAPARFRWVINGKVFTISGSVPSPLYPGAAPLPVPVTLSNPNSVPIYVTSLAAAIQSISVTNCPAGWFQSGGASIPSGGIMVPAGGKVVVPTAEDPTLRMLDSGTNQNVCQRARLTLSYSGIAHS